VLGPLVALTILFGFYPAPILDVTAASVKNLVQNYETAIRTTTALAR
jgi:NADH-quinone oxidoreductase subunit M